MGAAIIVVVLGDQKRNIRERAGNHPVAVDRPGLTQGRPGPDRAVFHAADSLQFLEVGMVPVEHHVHRIGGLVFEDAHEAGALVIGGLHAIFVAADDLLVVGNAGIAPGLLGLRLVRRLVVRDAQGEAQRVLPVLVDVHAADAIAATLIAGHVDPLCILVALVGERARSAAVGERTNGFDVGRARDTLVGLAGIRCLEDLHGADELGRILVELNRAVVVDGCLLATVQGSDSKVRAQAPNGQGLRAPVGALGGDTRQPRDRFGNGGVGELADVLG